MHELSIMEQTLDLALQSAQAQSAQRIHRLSLRVGALSGVVPDSLRFAFDVVVAETIAAQATLSIELVPVECWCDPCNQAFIPDDNYLYECPTCHQFSHHIIAGKELDLMSVEVS